MGRKIRGECLVFCLEWGQREKGDHSRISSSELGMSLERLDLEEQKGSCGSAYL